MITRGLTLLELMVTLAVLGLVVGITAISLPPAQGDRSGPAPESLEAKARRDAVALGQPITFSDTIHGRRFAVTAFPDGRIVMDSTVPHAQR
jgi:prepilin-type N-terminal cleavage/methylation domain-containing protein